MKEQNIEKITEELKILPAQVRATISLLDEGATVPFIARYRKEATGSLDEVVITIIRDRSNQLEELDKRKESILKSMEERNLLTDELKEKIIKAETITKLEDIYLPFRPKRRTRATIARERGLEPLAKIIFDQDERIDPFAEAVLFVDPEKEINSIEDALAGSRDIIAEWINEEQEARERMRDLYRNSGFFRSRVVNGKEKEGSKYKDYYDLEEPIREAPSHRILAMRRGEKEGFLDISLSPSEEAAIKLLEDIFVKGESKSSDQVKMAITDSYKRLLSLSMETELRIETKKKADEEAIKVFANNLRELLLAPPLGQKRVMAIDPGIRTGCKITCLDRQGKLLHRDTIYPFKSKDARSTGAVTIIELIKKYNMEVIAVGNGTAGRETISFIREHKLPDEIPVISVNESGASIYSASEVARNEFPDLDVTFRGAISIGRRLMDPLAELVKIDPKSIGVGQYQHDVNQQALKKSLDDAVISCVNGVGVEVNTASEQLLTYVSGLGPRLAKNIVQYRNEHGAFGSREDLKNINRLGPKAYEQAVGFLRIRQGKNPLDASAVHPESYGIVEKMATDLSCEINDLLLDEELRKKIIPEKYITDITGLPTLMDILGELEKPGRDPRKQYESLEFTEGIEKIEDLSPGMMLPGIVTNVAAFGAFVDIGVHQDGLVHISQLADHFVKDPHKEVRVNQQVKVWVLDVDMARSRISLSMKKDRQEHNKKASGDKVRSGKSNRSEKKKHNFPRGNGPFNNPFAKLLNNRR